MSSFTYFGLAVPLLSDNYIITLVLLYTVMDMVQEFSCKTAGAAQCPFMVRDESTDELVRIVQQHASRFHNEALDKEEVMKNVKQV